MSKDKSLYLGGFKIVEKDMGSWKKVMVSINFEKFEAWAKGAGRQYVKSSNSGDHFFNALLQEKREVGQYGDTHYLIIDDYKPQEQSQPAENKPVENQPESDNMFETPVDDPDDLPF